MMSFYIPSFSYFLEIKIAFFRGFLLVLGTTEEKHFSPHVRILIIFMSLYLFIIQLYFIL